MRTGVLLVLNMVPWRAAARTTHLSVPERHASLSRAEEGALAGALALGSTAALIRASMCEHRESCVGATIGVGLMGATVGAVVGGLILGASE